MYVKSWSSLVKRKLAGSRAAVRVYEKSLSNHRAFHSSITGSCHSLRPAWPKQHFGYFSTTPTLHGSYTVDAMRTVVLVDWGTSSFRAFHVRVSDGEVVDQVSDSEGGILNVKDFDAALETHCHRWPNVPAIICGMAGSNRGWKEVQYAQVPAALGDVSSKALRFRAKSQRPVTIISGLSCALPRVPQGQPTSSTESRQIAPDVMRGEETQIFGALSLLQNSPEVLILPGTHSKWSMVDASRSSVEYFKTYMTGEMFSIISKHSILRPATEVKFDMDSINLDGSFSDGVEIARKSSAGMLSDLFEVRRRLLAGFTASEDSLPLLSGMLIGHEIKSGVDLFGLAASSSVGIVGSASLIKLYTKALEHWNIHGVGVDGSQASRAGLLQILAAAEGEAKNIGKNSQPQNEGATSSISPQIILKEKLSSCPLVAILRGIKAEEAIPVVDALDKQGFSIVEVPWTSADCLQSIKQIAEKYGHKMLVGAGTIDTVDKVHAVADVGGKLIVTPNFNERVVKAALSRGMVVLPGIATPTEAFAALEAGAHALKLFPAEMITLKGFKAMKTVLPRDAILLPVGGIDSGTIPEYWKAGARNFGLGSSLYCEGMSLSEVRRRAKELSNAIKRCQSP